MGYGRGGRGRGRDQRSKGKGKGRGLVQRLSSFRKSFSSGKGGRRRDDAYKAFGSKKGNAKGKRRDTSNAGSGGARRNDSGLPEGHTIILIQYHRDNTSRTYLEFDNHAGAMDGLCQTYEQALKLQAAQERSAKYTLEDLIGFIEGLDDIGCLVYNRRDGDYRPRDRAWIKHKLILHLKGQVSSADA
mmetsp:Transcript_2768/g.4279  ORF Transcript_2768/g.4279 Transcript_2768/m.4279 type:complete len:187 (+) Transcript_2768:55-615(+)